MGSVGIGARGWVIVLVALFASAALAADEYAYLPPVAAKTTDLHTTANVTLYVNTAGSDANACTSPNANACATIAGALNKLPDGICHIVTIKVAAGNYTGASLERFYPCSDPAGANGGQLLIVGTMVPATLATGSPSYTFTSQATGSGNTWGVHTVSGATWTTNDLRGLALENTAIGFWRVIASNDATSLTIVGPGSGSLTTSSAMVVEDWGTVITTGGTFPGGSIPNYAAFTLGGGASNRTIAANFIYFQKMKISSAVPRCFSILGSTYLLARLVRCESGSSFDQVIYQGGQPTSVLIQDSVFKPASGRYAMTLDVSVGFLGRVMFWGSPGNGLRLYTAQNWSEVNDYYLSAGAAFGWVGYGNIFGNHYDGGDCLSFGSSTTGLGIYGASGYALVDSSNFTNCAGSGVYASGPITIRAASLTSTGAGNVRYGVEVLDRARVTFTGDTVTGTLGDTAVGPTPTVTAWGSIGTGVGSSADFSRISP